MTKKLLEVQHLKITFSGHQECVAVNDVSFSIQAGEILALLGMSGSGKTVTALSILRLLADRGKANVSGTITYQNKSGNIFEINTLRENELQKIRGKEIGLIFQNGQQALNPSMTCGKQVIEAILAHKAIGKAKAKQAVLQLFAELGLDINCYNKFPHQLSGGQQQRILIAIAISCEPTLIIADEPTASLDKQTQQEVIRLLTQLCRNRNTALLLITHDIKLVSEVAERVLIMHQGSIIEENTIYNILHKPKHDYTKQIIECFHQLRNNSYFTVPDAPEALLEEAIDKPLLKMHGVSAGYWLADRWFIPSKRLQVLKELDLEIFSGETLGLLGSSGSGKTTLAKIILALHRPDSGTVHLDGLDLVAAANHDKQQIYRKVQMVFQDAHASLNPRITIAESILEPVRYHKIRETEELRKQLIDELFAAVGLEKSLLYAYPHELSGGQRQRVALARALALRPQLIILDEPVASLDAATQLQVLDLLKLLKKKYKLSYLFISHDIDVLSYMSDRIAELKSGQLHQYQTIPSNAAQITSIF